MAKRNDHDRVSSSTSPIATQNYPELPKKSAARKVKLPKVGIPPRQHAAIELMLTGSSNSEIALALGISRKTLYTWRTDSLPFRAALERRRREVIGGAADRMRCLLQSALDALETQVTDVYAPTAHRAAKTLLSLARVGKIVADQAEKKPGQVDSYDESAY